MEIFSKNLESNEINITPFGFRFHEILKKSHVFPGYPEDISKLTVIVPIIKVSRIDLTMDTLIIMFIFCAILVIFFAFIHKFKLNPDYWSIFRIFGILIGSNIVEPRKKESRIVYVTIAILSIIFSNDYFSTLADIKLNFVEKRLKNMEDLYRLNIPIYILSVNYLFNDTELEKRLISYGQRIDTIEKCIELLIRTNNAACVCSSRVAEHYFKTNLDWQGRPIMKIADISFQYRYDPYIYEKASPFVEKIEKLVQMIFEASIMSVHDLLANSKVRITRTKSKFKEEMLLLKIILIILSVGYTLAVIVFVCKFVCFRILKFNKNVIF